MRIAAIDIGTNSLHMIVVRVRPDFSFEIIDREKEMIRLGAGGLDGRALTPEAMQAALQVLSKFRRLAESHRVDRIIAVATSAVREAENGGAFLQTIVRETRIRARVISGTEEARLIHLAAVYGVGNPPKPPWSSTSAAEAWRSRAGSARMWNPAVASSSASSA
jgi:exopolyphosphatase/guanosine-5'-triphosphate,3'-diphosphate pyrophosphatase